MHYTIELAEGPITPEPKKEKAPLPVEDTSGSKLERLERRKKELRQGGGTRLIDKQHAAVKSTARERLELLFDAGSFQELGMFVRHRCTNFGMED